MTNGLVKIKHVTSESGHSIPLTLSLIHHCTSCRDSCCEGRTLVTDAERRVILSGERRDHLTRWSENIYYLDDGPCPYLSGRLCSIQQFKPFVCRVFPFVPRVALGTWWLYLVSECPVSGLVTPEFMTQAVELAKKALRTWNRREYELYWAENKMGDFDEIGVILRLPVYPEHFAVQFKEKTQMEDRMEVSVPGCVRTYAELVGEGEGFQVLRVSVEDGGEIPLHAHDCTATMVILGGSAITLGKDGRHVKPGDVVVKAAREPHGFTATSGSFAFLSISTGSGIFKDGEWDLQFFQKQQS